MSDEPKYKNLTQRFPELQEVLATSIQSDFLEINKIDRACEKYQKLVEKFPQLQEAVFVIFSKYIKKEDREHEIFVFINDKGTPVCHVSGREMALYGLLSGCNDLEINEEYAYCWAP